MSDRSANRYNKDLHIRDQPLLLKINLTEFPLTNHLVE